MRPGYTTSSNHSYYVYIWLSVFVLRSFHVVLSNLFVYWIRVWSIGICKVCQVFSTRTCMLQFSQDKFLKMLLIQYFYPVFVVTSYNGCLIVTLLLFVVIGVQINGCKLQSFCKILITPEKFMLRFLTKKLFWMKVPLEYIHFYVKMLKIDEKKIKFWGHNWLAFGKAPNKGKKTLNFHLIMKYLF
jgi:hypothetical protein